MTQHFAAQPQIPLLFLLHHRLVHRGRLLAHINVLVAVGVAMQNNYTHSKFTFCSSSPLDHPFSLHI